MAATERKHTHPKWTGFHRVVENPRKNPTATCKYCAKTYRSAQPARHLLHHASVRKKFPRSELEELGCAIFKQDASWAKRISAAGAAAAKCTCTCLCGARSPPMGATTEEGGDSAERQDETNVGAEEDDEVLEVTHGAQNRAGAAASAVSGSTADASVVECLRELFDEWQRHVEQLRLCGSEMGAYWARRLETIRVDTIAQLQLDDRADVQSESTMGLATLLNMAKLEVGQIVDGVSKATTSVRLSFRVECVSLALEAIVVLCERLSPAVKTEETKGGERK